MRIAKAITRWVLAIAYIAAGILHIAAPRPFLTIMPDWVPLAEQVVYWTGIAEIAGGLALLQPFSHRLRQAGGVGLALYALCVWPANINHFAMDMARADSGLGLAYHVPRMIAQPILIGLTLWASEIWPRGGAAGEVRR